jgi:hypothetical protein
MRQTNWRYPYFSENYRRTFPEETITFPVNLKNSFKHGRLKTDKESTKKLSAFLTGGTPSLSSHFHSTTPLTTSTYAFLFTDRLGHHCNTDDDSPWIGSMMTQLRHRMKKISGWTMKNMLYSASILNERIEISTPALTVSSTLPCKNVYSPCYTNLPNPARSPRFDTSTKLFTIRNRLQNTCQLEDCLLRWRAV